MMLLAIGLIALQTSVLTFAVRTAVRHYDMQAYLSARSTATALTEAIIDMAETHILSYSQEDRVQIGTLPTEELTNAAQGEPLEGAELQLMVDMMALEEGQSITLSDVAFADVPAGMKAGDLTATITCTSTSAYEISVTATVEDEVETVTTELSYTKYTLPVTYPDYSEPGEPEEVIGNAMVFYSDYGFGIQASATVENQLIDGDSGIPFISSLPIYLYDIYDTGSQLYDRIQSYQDIYIDGTTEKAQGNLLSRTNITVADITLSGLYIHADEQVTILDNTTVNGTGIYADTVYIKGDNITISSPITAKTVIIDGDVTIGGKITADYIQFVEGSNSSGGSISCAALNAHVCWVSAPIYNDETTTDADGNQVMLLEYYIAEALDNSVDISNILRLYEGTTTIEMSGINQSVAIAVDEIAAENYVQYYTGIAPRSTPEWAVLDGLEGADYIGNFEEYSEEEHKIDLSNEESPDYYILKAENLENGTLTLNYNWKDTAWNSLCNDSSITEDTPLIFVIQAGETITLLHDQTDIDHVYFILQGNAQLKIEQATSEPQLRIYGESPSAAVDTAIRSEVVALAAQMEEDGSGAGEIQNAINSLIQSKYLDQIASVELLYEQNPIMATVVVPYIYSTSDYFGLKGFPYTEGNYDSSLDGDDEYGDTTTVVGDIVDMIYFNFHSYKE